MKNHIFVDTEKYFMKFSIQFMIKAFSNPEIRGYFKNLMETTHNENSTK